MKTTYHQIEFCSSRYEAELCNKIANRAVAMAAALGVDYSKSTALMDIEAAHCNGCPLDLAGLLAADKGTFGHDVFGIRRHIDRNTGKLGGCFLPRTALPEASKLTTGIPS